MQLGKRYLAIVLLIGILIGVGISYGYLLLMEQLRPSQRHGQVGVFYYVWYDPAESVSWEYPKICDKPILGYYNSCDSMVIQQHLTWMSDLRINFAIISWWGFYNQTDWSSFINNATYQVFKTARENITNVKLCIMVEPFNSPPYNKTDNPTYDYTGIYDYINRTFVQPYPTNYYKYEEKPLVCFFNDQYLTPNPNVIRNGDFTVKIVGGDTYADWIYLDLIKDLVSEPTVRNRQVSVTPRFDDSRFRSPQHTNDTDLTEGVYDKGWQRAISLTRSNAIDVVTICSWNEYPERTAIEPHWDADAYDHNPYFLYNKTKQYIFELKGYTT
jgi:hypothetical protein